MIIPKHISQRANSDLLQAPIKAKELFLLTPGLNLAHNVQVTCAVESSFSPLLIWRLVYSSFAGEGIVHDALVRIYFKKVREISVPN